MATHNRLATLRRGGVAAGLGLAGLSLAGCTSGTLSIPSNELWNFGFPTGITPEAEAMRSFWTFSAIMALAVGVLVWALMFIPIIFHRKKAGSPEFPRQTQYNVPLEIIYTIIPFIFIAILFFINVKTEDKVLAKVPEDEVPVIVDVTAFQWNWKFGYGRVDSEAMGQGDAVRMGKPSQFEGSSDEYYQKIDNDLEKSLPSGWKDARDHAVTEAAVKGTENEEYFSFDGYRGDLGTTHEQSEAEKEAATTRISGTTEYDFSYLAFDNIETVGTTAEIPVLVLPTNTRIQFNLNSADVSHGFAIAEFLFKRDVYSHPEANNSDNKFQVSEIEREGSFIGRCTEMCGTYHSMMNFEVRAVSPQDFVRYMQAREEGMTNAEALASIGQAPRATLIKPWITERDGTRDGDNHLTDN